MDDINLILKTSREQIDTIDKELIYLLSRRFNLVSTIGDIKKENNIKTLQPGRWQEVLDMVKSNSVEFGVNPEFTLQIWELIHKEALSIENNK